MSKSHFILNPLRALLLAASFATVLAPFTALAADKPAEDELPQLEPQAEQGVIEQLVSGYYADRVHFGKPELDDKLSAAFFKRYLETLDSGRIYFTQQDLAQFEKYRTTLDDALENGDVSPAYEMYRVLRDKIISRIDKINTLLETEPDFTVNETFNFDRTDAEWAASEAELDEYWRKRIKNEAIGLLQTDKSWNEAADTLRDRYRNFRRRLLQVNSQDVFDQFMNAYTTTLDPHSTYFSPRDSEEFRIRMSLSYEGIGASLQTDGEYVKIVRLIPGGAAAKSGKLNPNDRITGVGQSRDGEIVDVIGWRLDEVVDLIRGPKDTIVRLHILPAGRAPGGAEEVIELTRREIQLEEQAAQAETIEVDRGDDTVKIGVIEIPTFYQDTRDKMLGKEDYRSTTRDVRRLIEEQKANGVQGFVIDLRDNGGGLLNEATDLTGLFIDKGPVVQIKNSFGGLEVQEDTDAGVAWDGPLVVLVNRFSASASEIFAGAIQDYGRGLVVGTTTYGKGTVQNLFDLNRHQMHLNTDIDLGQLKMTMGKFYRVTGSSTQHRGVEPDIVLPSPINLSEIGESSQPTALPWDEIPAAADVGEVRLRAVDLLPELRERISERQASDDIFQVYLKDVRAQREMRETSVVSLNLAERRAERKASEQEILERLNARRTALGMSPVESLEEAEEKSDDYDVLRHEAARIVADYLAELTPMKKNDEKLAVSSE